MERDIIRILKPIFLIISLVLSQTACYDRKTAVEMTKAGIETSDLLAEYYTTVANNQRTVYELKEFNRSMDMFSVYGSSSVPQLSSEQLNTAEYYTNIQNCELVRAIILDNAKEEIERQTKDLTESERIKKVKELTPPPFDRSTEVEKGRAATRCMIAALEQRADLARKFSKYFNSFKETADYNFSGQVKDATNDLAKSFSSLIPLPYVGAIAASGLIGEVTGDIAAGKQKNNVLAQTKTSLQIFTAVKSMFDLEKPIYSEVNGLLVLESSKAGKHLIEGDMVQVWRLIDVVPDTLGLKVINDKWSGPIPPQKQIDEQKDSEEVKTEKKLFNKRREAFLDGFTKLIEARQNRITGSLNAAAGSISGAMAKMQNTLSEYINNSKSVSTSEITAYLNRATFYLEEAKKLKNELDSTKKITEKNDAANQ